MKKILTHLTGIVFVIAILVAGGCNRGKNQIDSTPEESDPATLSLIFIKCEAVEKNGKLEFRMWDRNKDTIVATISSEDTLILENRLETEVRPGEMVLWLWGKDSDVTTFENIAPRNPNGKIMPGPAQPEDEKRIFKLIIPNDIPPGTKEKYYIEFVWKQQTVKVDPHLKVPEL